MKDIHLAFTEMSWIKPSYLRLPAWAINYIHYKVWDEINYTFPNFNGAPLKFGDE